jgi:glycosyltransferase 2 family protein
MVMVLESPPPPVKLFDRQPAELRRPVTTVATPSNARRVRPSRVVNVLGAAGVLISAVLLFRQLRTANLGAVWQHVQVEYVVAAVGLMGLSLVAAAYNLLGFSPLRLRLVPTVGAQLAVSGLRVIAPSAVSTPAIAARYLKCSGASASDAMATVAVAQSAQLLVTGALVAGLGVWSGAATFGGVAAARTIVIAVAAVGAIVAIGWAAARWSDRLRAGLLAGRRSMATLGRHARRRPAMVAAGLAGATALTITHVLAFALCLSAVGGHASVLSLTLVYLAAASAGSLIPTPGGVGAVEAALIAGLTATGVALPVAAAASLLSRLVSVWLLAIPGWIALGTMRRRGLL